MPYWPKINFSTEKIAIEQLISDLITKTEGDVYNNA